MDERARPGGPVEGRMPLPIAHVHIAAAIEKEADDVRASELGSPVNWFSPGEVLCVKRCASPDQRLGNFSIRCPKEWRIAAFPRAIHICAGLDKESDKVELF